MKHTPIAGFTLVELLVVISVITVLLGIGMPGLAMAMRRSSQQSTVNIIGAAHAFCYETARSQWAGEPKPTLEITRDGLEVKLGSQVAAREIGKGLRVTADGRLALAQDYLPTSYALVTTRPGLNPTRIETTPFTPLTLTYNNGTGFVLDPTKSIEVSLRQGGNPQAPGYKLTFFSTGLMKVSGL